MTNQQKMAALVNIACATKVQLPSKLIIKLVGEGRLCSLNANISQRCNYLHVFSRRGCTGEHHRQAFSTRPCFAGVNIFRQVRSSNFVSSPNLSRFYTSTRSLYQKNITKDILDSKVAALPKTDTASSENQSRQSKSSNARSSQDNPDEDKTKDEKKRSWWFRKENAWKVGLISLGAFGAMMCGNILMFCGVPAIGEDGNLIEDEFSNLPKWQGYPRRAMMQMRFFKKMIEQPSSPVLLPDPLKEPWYQPPYTLVLEMTGILVHPDWTIGTGWRFKKRPGLDYFLQQVASPLYEIVIYTHEQGFTAFPIIDGLDPNGLITFRLFRDATHYRNGCHVKDLSCLNRDPSKVIIVDCDPKAFSLQPQNALLLKKWTGEDSDRSLIDLAAFLRMIALSEVDDVRPVLEYYGQFDDPLAVFKEKQRLLQEQQASAARSTAEAQGLVGNWSLGVRGRKQRN